MRRAEGGLTTARHGGRHTREKASDHVRQREIFIDTGGSGPSERCKSLASSQTIWASAVIALSLASALCLLTLLLLDKRELQLPNPPQRFLQLIEIAHQL